MPSARLAASLGLELVARFGGTIIDKNPPRQLPSDVIRPEMGHLSLLFLVFFNNAESHSGMLCGRATIDSEKGNAEPC